jgi:hypothetical protein
MNTDAAAKQKNSTGNAREKSDQSRERPATRSRGRRIRSFEEALRVQPGRLLKNCFNRRLDRVTDGLTKSCTFLCACPIYQMWGSAAKTTPMLFQ